MGVDANTQLHLSGACPISGLINEQSKLVFHRILDLKRGWIFILVPFFCRVMIEGNRITTQDLSG
jgi:hypothetical protein